MHCEVHVGCIVQFAQRTYRCVHIAKYSGVTIALMFGAGGPVWLMVWLPFRGHHRQSRLNHFINKQVVACGLDAGCAVSACVEAGLGCPRVEARGQPSVRSDGCWLVLWCDGRALHVCDVSGTRHQRVPEVAHYCSLYGK